MTVFTEYVLTVGQSVEKNIRFQTKGIRVDKGPIESNSRKYVWGCLYPGGAPNNGLYEKALPERGIFLRLQVYERVEILLVEVHEREGKSVIGSVKGSKGLTDDFYGFIKSRKTFYFCDPFLLKRKCIYSR